MSSLRVGIIPARKGSKGFVGKNLACIEGTPLYLRAVRQSLRLFDVTILTTDIDGDQLQELPMEVNLHKRSAKNSSDTATMSAVLKEVITSCQLDNAEVILLQPTSPLRVDSDIIDAIRIYESNDFDLVMSVSQACNSVLKCGTLINGNFQAIRTNSDCFQNRQSMPTLYKPNGAVYVFNSSWFISNDYSLCTSNIGASIMSIERSYDIDTKQDFENILKEFER
jgi:CMP-N,N'-diacetyllegionaminic acid synthase